LIKIDQCVKRGAPVDIKVGQKIVIIVHVLLRIRYTKAL
jgi:hypothetical protein